jgi:ribosomal protein L44E
VTASQGKHARTYLSTAPPMVSYAYVARRPMAMGDHVRQPGQLVPEAADWKGKVRQCHLDLGWIEEFALTNDADREAFDNQWKAEEQARKEAVKQHPKPDTWSIPETKRPPKPLRYLCANCQWPHTWQEPPADDQWFRCQRCGQNQTTEMARKGTLRLVSPAFNHNRKASSFRQVGG